MNSLSEVDKAYIAGLLDGEGCIGYYNASNKSPNRPPYYHASVNICNTDPRPILWLQEVTGIGRSAITTFKDGKRRPAYQWQIGRKKQVQQFLEVVRPYLRIKDKQADVLVTALILESSYTKRHGSVTPEVVAVRRETELALKVLKRAA